VADERVNRKDEESRICKKEREGGRDKIYEFAVTAMALAYSPTFFRLRTEYHEQQRKREKETERERERERNVGISYSESMSR